jgi:MarR family transcriptional regulator, lower aerobic nicotinate degradation pathway regulator
MARTPLTSNAGVDPRGEFPLDVVTYVFHLLAFISRHREARLDEILHPLGLNLSRYRALSVVATFEPCTMSQLADYTATDRTTLTRTVDHLVDDGFVARTTPREDRRQVLLTVTEPGQDAYRRAAEAIRRLNRQLLAVLEDDDQRQVARALTPVLERLVDEPELRRRLLLRHTDADAE